MEIAPMTLSTGKILYPGSLYKLRIHISQSWLDYLPHIETHPLIWDRIMCFKGRDTTRFVVHSSFVFSDDLQFDDIFHDSSAFDAFKTMTNICSSRIDKEAKTWSIHICEHDNSGRRKFTVMDT